MSSQKLQQREFVYPTGIEMVEGENYHQAQGYDVVYLKDEESPRYQFSIVASNEKLSRIFCWLSSLLPEEVSPILEIPSENILNSELCDVWVGSPIAKNTALDKFREFEEFFTNDGLVGFGLLSPKRDVELFLDEHKVIYIFSRSMDAPADILSMLGICPRAKLKHFTQLDHFHLSVSDSEKFAELANKLKKLFGLEWEESKEYS